MDLQTINKLKEFLSDHGTVKRVEWSEEKGELHIEVTEMKLKGIQSFRIMNEVLDITENEFPNLGRTNIEPTHINVILKK